MRYFIVNYIRTPRGQTDEIVSVSKKIKLKDLQTASVILDFKTCQVVLANMEGTSVPRDWHKIRDYYHQHYRSVIDQLENTWQVPATAALAVGDQSE